jgi:hypothetical protein
MQAHRVETIVKEDGIVTIEGLPFNAGEVVEVIIFPRATLTEAPEDRYPLRGTPFHYEDPTEPVAVEDWEAEQ